MEAIFEQIKNANKNNVEGLMDWMKNAKLTESINEDQLKQLFSNVPNPKDIPLQNFTEILTKFAAEHKKPLEEFVQKLVGSAPEFLKSKVSAAGKALGNLGQ